MVCALCWDRVSVACVECSLFACAVRETCLGRMGHLFLGCGSREGGGVSKVGVCVCITCRSVVRMLECGVRYLVVCLVTRLSGISRRLIT